MPQTKRGAHSALPPLPLDRLPALQRVQPLDLDDVAAGRPFWRCTRYGCGCAVTNASGAFGSPAYSGELTQFMLAALRPSGCDSSPSLDEVRLTQACYVCRADSARRKHDA